MELDLAAYPSGGEFRPIGFVCFQKLAAFGKVDWPSIVGIDKGQVLSRVQAYALKMAREGKQKTSWTDPSETYETALADFVARIPDPQISAGFLDSFTKFARRAALLGALNSLSQLTLKATLPGVPDFYQGTSSLIEPGQTPMRV